jgi:hypothetical protein
MRFIGPKRRLCLRFANLVGFAVWLFAICGLSSRSDAGVIFPQADPPTTISYDFSVGSCTSSTGAFDSRESTGEQQQPTERRESQFIGNDQFGDLPGGASTPETGGNGATTLVLIAPFDSPGPVEPPGSVFARWSEASLHLPRPRAEELLDPPKSCA